MNYDSLVNGLKEVLEHTAPGLVNGAEYAKCNRQLGMLYHDMKQELDAVYHFTESHGMCLRYEGVFQNGRALCSKKEPRESSLNVDCLSFYSSYAIKGKEGLIERLKEMPSEWTIIQLTRAYDPQEKFICRRSDQSPGLKYFYLLRLPCGSELDVGCPVCVRCEWPETANDLIQSFIDISKKLSTKQGTSAQIRKTREAASLDVKRHCDEMGQILFKEWIILLSGNLCSRSLEKEVRQAIDERIDSCPVSLRERYLCYLLGEGCCYLSPEEMEVFLYQVFPENETLAVRILEALVRIKENLETRLIVAARNPVLFVLDNHLEVISWESIPILRPHPVSRVYSVHMAHVLYTVHKEFIFNGLREVSEDEVGFYIVNPDGNLPMVEEKMTKFLKKRFPTWVGVIGQKPTDDQLLKALTQCYTYMYCGHGSGSQYLSSVCISRFRVRPVQLLYGCSSSALRDHGGSTEMTGDVMEYALAGSGCTLGMLWPVTSNDADKMAMMLANVWFPGTPVDITTFEEGKNVRKEPELLRVLKQVRKCSDLYTNGAAFVARGIPIKLVTKKENK